LRLYRYRSGGSSGPRLALATGPGPPVDLSAAVTAAETGPPLSHVELTGALVGAGEDVWRAARSIVASTGLEPLASDRTWLCPLDVVSSLRDFLSFEDHVKRGAQRRGSDVPPYWYEAPVYYKGNHRALLGPDDVCGWPSFTDYLDFELELAMIVGRGGRDIAVADAHRHIFGFTIFNDFSARDVQAREISAWLGPAKSKDFANAFGPCIVTVDEVGPEPDLAMSCRVNGEEWGRARSSEMHWSWAEMIAHVSRDEDIHPGDVYGSGTPGGCCGLDLGRRLAPGDVVELEIESMGVLRNAIGPRS
jgi:2-keto-4-pentenoate hydratase/2-oxohepta-3-ene-1,7-dioic acid hydratase in catechol pathway